MDHSFDIITIVALLTLIAIVQGVAWLYERRKKNTQFSNYKNELIIRKG